MIDIARLRQEIFRENTMENLKNEALSNCQAIVADVFSDDINDLRSEFPPEIEQKEVIIQFQSMRLNLAHSEMEVPSLEIIITMQTADGSGLGYYMMVFDKELKCIDEHFVIE